MLRIKVESSTEGTTKSGERVEVSTGTYEQTLVGLDRPDEIRVLKQVVAVVNKGDAK